ncbi:TetR family transcriptional regulator [Hoyosella sp. YIM 151337]|uniref:acyl-CoA-like ligand-binding transcription factor n=1 Tax=Hoyosella sp. YIM 151337 TaxID=2992742 RepID=UPI002235D360|nr:TetR family transcriptional regulator [Hoyosella sp. YIM 151337]MCW4352655.1 TetR family transcriptional regulator [Hoyosella sp. YIM 151337]
MEASTGLRERKKAATRAALSAATVRIIRERGIEAATAEAVAAEVGVSARTFHNYFANRDEAIVFHLETRLEWLTEKLAATPSDKPILSTLRALVADAAEDDALRLGELASALLLAEANPHVAASNHVVFTRAMGKMVRIVAERTGTDPDTDLYPHVVLMSAAAALRSAVELWLTGKVTDRSLPDVLGEAFDLIESGLQQPCSRQISASARSHQEL